MIQWVLHLPIWGLIRAFGLISFTLLFIGISLGIIYSLPIGQPKRKAKLYRWHFFCTNFGTLLGLIHGVLLVIDTYMPFSWKDILLPFTAKNNPVLSGLGTLTAYGALLLIFTSDIRNKLKRKIWHGIHLLAYPIFFMGLIHGLFLGTDSVNGWVKYLYLISFSVVILLTALRLVIEPEKRNVISRTKL